MRLLHRRATPQFFPSASLPTAFHYEHISFLSLLAFSILRHFSRLPNLNSAKCDFRNSDKLPTTQMWPQRWLGFSMRRWGTTRDTRQGSWFSACRRFMSCRGILGTVRCLRYGRSTDSTSASVWRR